MTAVRRRISLCTMKKMLSSKKEVLIAFALIAVTVGSGLLMQVLLQIREMRSSQREATAVVSMALDEIHSAFQEVRDAQDAAATRMAALPQRKQDRLEDLQLDLLMIVSADSPLPEGYVPELDTVVGDYVMDARCASVCWQMMQDCRNSGHGLPMICSAYRTQEYQQILFDNKVYDLLRHVDDLAHLLALNPFGGFGCGEHGGLHLIGIHRDRQLHIEAHLAVEADGIVEAVFHSLTLIIDGECGVHHRGLMTQQVP